MTCGIYTLRFIGTEKVYVGQSLNIENRFKEHTKGITSGICSKKLLEASKLYGLPYIRIEEECEARLLNFTEVKYINQYNSKVSGFNTLGLPGSMYKQAGEYNGNSKFDNFQIETAFLLLTDTVYTSTKVVASITGVSVSMLGHMLQGENHTWLKEEYPERYLLLSSRKGKKSKEYPTIISPSGIEVNFTNKAKFAKDNNLCPTGVANLISGKLKEHRGWVLKI